MNEGKLSPASYVPNCVLRRHASLLLDEDDVDDDESQDSSGSSKWERNPERLVCSHHVDFALVILDVSGFTKISGWLQKHKGSEGPELMSTFLSQYFHKMLDIVAFYGGDVLKFAGDALLIKFDATPKALRSACICAAVAVEELDNYVLRGDVPHSLSLHAAVHVGKGEEMFVGGVRGRWEHCVSGTLFQNIGAVLDLATSGSVLVSGAVERNIRDLTATDPEPGFSLVETELHVDDAASAIGADSNLFVVNLDQSKLKNAYPKDSLPGSNLSFAPSSRTAVQVVSRQPLRRFKSLSNLPVPLSNKRLQAVVKRYCLPNIDSIMSTVFSAEMRDITTMFCLLPPYFAGGECASLYQQMVVAFQIILTQFDGRLRQFLTDDKGTVLIACFGLPGTSVIARELRAVRAANGFRRKIRLLRNSPGYENVQIGISRGLVYCGNIGDTSRCEYCVVGDSVNMAARLMGLAKKRALHEKLHPSTPSPRHNGRNKRNRRRKAKSAKRSNGHIYIDSHVYDAVSNASQGDFGLSDGFDVVVKGKSEPMKCFEVFDTEMASGGRRGRRQPASKHQQQLAPRRNARNAQGRRLSAISHNHSTPIFVGRDPQLDMANMILSSRPKTPSLLYFRGAKGLGKSTMLSRVSKMAAVLNYRVATAYPNLAPETGESLSYATVRSWLRQLFNFDGSLCMQTYQRCSTQQQQRLRALLLQASENPLPKVYGAAMQAARVIPGPDADNASASPHKGSPLTVAHINDLLVTLFDHLYALLGSRLVLAIDDIEYTDVESLLFLQKFMTLTSASPIIIATKGDDGAHSMHSRVDTCEDVKSLERATMFKFEFQLVRLERDACDNLIRHIFTQSSHDEDPYGVALVADEVVDFIHTRSAGNPLYIHEMIKFVLGRKQVVLLHEAESLVWRMVEQPGQGPSTGPEPLVPGPSSMHNELRDILLGRLEDCSFAARSTLKTASIIGKFFSRAELAALLPNKKKDVLAMELDELVSAQIVVVQDNDEFSEESDDGSSSESERSSDTNSTDGSRRSGIVYSFIHSSMYETVYSLLLVGHRKKLHRQFAEYLERIHADPSLAVFHFERSDKPVAALCPYLRWGTRLGELSELARSIAVFEKAVDIVNTLMEEKRKARVPVEFNTETCYYGSLFLKIMVKLLQQKVAYVAMTNKQESLEELYNKLNAFMDMYGERADNAEVLRVLSVGMWVLLFNDEDNFEQILHTANRLVLRSARLEDPKHRIRALIWRLVCSYIEEDEAARVDLHEQIEELFHSQDDPLAGSMRIAETYGTNYDITTMSFRRNVLLMRGQFQKASLLWSRVEPYAAEVKQGQLYSCF